MCGRGVCRQIHEPGCCSVLPRGAVCAYLFSRHGYMHCPYTCVCVRARVAHLSAVLQWCVHNTHTTHSTHTHCYAYQQCPLKDTHTHTGNTKILVDRKRTLQLLLKSGMAHSSARHACFVGAKQIAGHLQTSICWVRNEEILDLQPPTPSFSLSPCSFNMSG